MSNNTEKPNVTLPLLFALSILFFFIGGFLTWALLAPLESAAIAQGKIIVDTNRKTIQHLEGGIVKKIHIREGSKVQKNDLLVELDGTQPQATLDLLRGRSNALYALEARLIAERDDLAQIDYPNELILYASEPKIKKIITGQNALFDANKQSYQDQIKILNQRIQQLHKEIESIEAQVQSESTQLELIEEEIVAVAYLADRQLIEKPRLLALKREAARLAGNRGEDLGLIARAMQRIGETKTQIIGIKNRMQKETLEQLREAQRELADILERQKTAEDILKRTSIRAPRSGIVVDLRAHTVGGIIKPGDDILGIVPSTDLLIIEARVDPLDIDVVRTGLTAKVQLSAYKQRHTPQLNGIVIHISADSFENQQTGATYYLARIELDKEELSKLKNITLHPGMPVQVLIITDKRTPFNYFITPIKDSFTRAFRED